MKIKQIFEESGKFRKNKSEEQVMDKSMLMDMKNKYVPDWEMLDHRILTAKYFAENHRHAVEFVDFINKVSEYIDHFAEVTQDVAEVTVKTTTSDTNSLTILDFALAKAIDDYANKNNIEQERIQGNFEESSCPRTRANKCQCESVNQLTEDQQEITAVCVLEHSDTVKGTIIFKQEPGSPTFIAGEITGLTPGEHGFHIHEYGDLSRGCESAGGHFNPTGVDHGDLKNGHVGDLGNIIANENGVARVAIVAERVNLTGDQSVVGRAVVVHEDEDDLGQGGDAESLKTGNAGDRLACGVITLKESFDESLDEITRRGFLTGAGAAAALGALGKSGTAFSEPKDINRPGYEYYKVEITGPSLNGTVEKNFDTYGIQDSDTLKKQLQQNFGDEYEYKVTKIKNPPAEVDLDPKKVEELKTLITRLGSDRNALITFAKRYGMPPNESMAYFRAATGRS